MRIATTRSAPWNRRDYPRIVSAVHRAGVLTVGFADGATVRLGVEAFRERRGTRHWDRVGHTEYEIVVPREADEDDEIPWDVIRALADPAFAAHLDEMAAAAARWVGTRVGELRRGRGLSVDALAQAAGLPREVVETVEAGTHDGELGEQERIARAMDREMKDLHRPRDSVRDAASRLA